HDPLHHRQSSAPFRARPRRAGLAVRRLQSHAVDGHRPLCRQTGAPVMSRIITRRRLLTTGAAAAGTTLLAGCDRFAETFPTRRLLDFGQLLSLHAQRLLLAGQPLVREYSMDDISPDFPSNGTAMPEGFGYFELITTN